MSLPTYKGRFGEEEATRLLFRAGFGPRPGEARAVARRGLERAVNDLLKAKPGKLHGPRPSGDFLVGGRFAPEDKWGHGHLEWLDRMVRSSNQLQERMALVWHDWFATGQSGAEQKHMREQIEMFRRSWKGPMHKRLDDVTRDPAMLQWLNGLDNRKGEPNENYAREVMELFALGADRGAYTEEDVRELARCFTGYRADWDEDKGLHNFRLDPEFHDDGRKVLFAGKKYKVAGNLDPKDAIKAIVEHPLHASFVAEKLWGYFIGSPIDKRSLRELSKLYVRSGTRIEPLLRAILMHPELYRGPAMVKPPVVYLAGMLRGRRMGIDRDDWVWISYTAGQMLWDPPNVSGWNDDAWLDTSRYAGRWAAATQIVNSNVADPEKGFKAQNKAQALEGALRFWGNPTISPAHRARLARVAAMNTPSQYGGPENFSANRQNVLRMMVMTAPEAQVC